MKEISLIACEVKEVTREYFTTRKERVGERRCQLSYSENDDARARVKRTCFYTV